VISHFKAVGRQTWGDFRAALKMILNAQKDGLDVSFDFFPYLRTGSMLVSLLPAWAKKGTTSEIMARFDDAAMRSRILDELSKMTIHSEKIMFASAAEDKKIVGKSLKDIIEHTGLASEETILDILKINNLSVTIFGRTLHPKNLLRSARFSNSILATDGAGYNLNFARSGDLAHPRAFGAYPRFLNKIAPAAKLKIQDAVKKMAYAPAKAAGFATRGLIEKNFTADIAIFETSFKDASTYKNPYSYATGLSHLIISGRMSVEGDKITAKNGEALAKNER